MLCSVETAALTVLCMCQQEKAESASAVWVFGDVELRGKNQANELALLLFQLVRKHAQYLFRHAE